MSLLKAITAMRDCGCVLALQKNVCNLIVQEPLMRQFTLIVVFYLPFMSLGQTPNYFANNPKWVCGHWNSNQWGPPPNIPTTSTYVYYLNADTLIGGNTFHRVFSRGETYENGPTPIATWDSHTGYYLRQEDRNIRFYNNQIGVDSLLVSYDYQIGDTVKGYVFQTCGYHQDTIQKIDSILINSEYRKVFYLDTISGPVITEGIGHQIEIDVPTGEFIEPLCAGIGSDFSIHCFGFGDIPYWDSQGTNGNCYLNVSIEKSQKMTFDIFPNPATHQIQIITHGEVNSISIRTIGGSKCLNTKGKIIDISMLRAGVYIVEIRFENGLISNQKLIVW